jgi:hypothetical protein
MADFIAVIRRAVDGLSENTPDMRVKVYDRARSAVVRQLENMKPRPPESMFQRQLDKLDAAIREVETDYAEALPPEPIDEPAPQPEPQSWTEPDREPEPVAEAPEPAIAAEEPQPEPAAEELHTPAEPMQAYEEPAASSMVQESEAAPDDAEQPIEQAAEQAHETEIAPAQPVDEPLEDPATADDYRDETHFTPETVDQEPSFEPAGAREEFHDPAPAGYVEPGLSAEAPTLPYDGAEEAVRSDAPYPGETAEPDWRDDTVAGEHDHVHAAHEPAPLVEAEPIEPDAEPFTWPQYQEPTPDASVSEPAYTEVVQAEWPQTTIEDAPPVAADTTAQGTDPFADPRGWAVEPETRETESRREPEMPRVVYDEADVVSGFNAFVQEEISRQVVPPPPGKRTPDEDLGWGAGFDDLPDLPKTEAFDDALKAKQVEIASAPESDAAPRDKTPRAELAELVGFDEMTALTSPDPEWVQVPPAVAKRGKKASGKGFRPGRLKERGGKTGRRLLPLVAGVAGVVVLAGAAYGGWTYREDLGKMIASITGPSETQTPPQVEKAVPQSETPEKSAEAPAAAAKPTEVASLETGPQKFTQRLMPDGRETESDASKAIVDEALPEGKSVAGQTEKSKEVASTDPTAPAADAKPASPAGAGVTQKMFLYEERLGQTTPSATPGAVAWSETTEDDGDKPVPSIQAKVEAPGRKLTALITFKKNMDPSLPASHIVEIVFDLPTDFEEGNVESVQRIAFKQTEQDAGNPLIAVPAKVTDDYHMIALNSDAEAQKVNLDLMKNRGWIDIPITYRNGRRGLITLEKGASGAALFDKVIGEWSALGNQASVPQ